MTKELVALDRTGTWDLVPLPPHVAPITFKWVFKIETKSDGSLRDIKLISLQEVFSRLRDEIMMRHLLQLLI